MMLKPMQTRHADNERIKREHQLGQRIAQEREYWRRFVADLIVEERERLVEALNQKSFDGEALASITRIVKDGLDQGVRSDRRQARRAGSPVCRFDAPS